MGYDRQIKYVDYYENEERLRGGGFVKTEVRDDRLKLELNVRGLYPTDTFVRDVVLKCADAEAVLGQISLQEGQGRFACSCNMDRGIGDTGISYDSLEEMKVPIGGSRELRCVWKKSRGGTAEPAAKEQKTPPVFEGRPVYDGTAGESGETADVGKDADDRKPDEKERTEVVPIAETAWKPEVMRVSETAWEPEAVQEAKAARKSEAVREPEAVRIAETVQAPEAVPIVEAAREMETVREAEAIPIAETAWEPEAVRRAEDIRMAGSPGSAESAGNTKGSAEPADSRRKKRAVKLLEEKWQQISAIYPHIRPFQDEREYLSLGPSDFVLFPEKFYRIANNSFLLHGYYNYEHLILARVEQRGETRYYLGVPGNYYDREKQVAVMFGFESFECDREPAQSGDFGYYMMRVEI